MENKRYLNDLIMKEAWSINKDLAGYLSMYDKFGVVGFVGHSDYFYPQVFKFLRDRGIKTEKRNNMDILWSPELSQSLKDWFCKRKITLQ